MKNSNFDRKLTFSSVQLFGATTNNVKHLVNAWNPIDLLFSVFKLISFVTTKLIN